MNKIHPSVVIEGDVQFGDDNEILPFTFLRGPLKIGSRNIIGPHAVIGTPGQDTRNPLYDSSKSRIEIGDDNIIREFVAIQKPCYKDLTQIGNRTYLMQGANINHDILLQDEVVITGNAVLAGITTVMTAANVAIGATVHQYCVVGAYAIVGMGAAVTKNVKPFSRYIPGKPISVNEYAITKYGFAKQAEEIRNFVIDNKRPSSITLIQIVDEFQKFVAESKRETYA